MEYYYDSTALKSHITSYNNKLEEYNEIVQDISRLIRNIESSNEWIQDGVKSLFIDKCTEYLTFYTNTITKIEAHINYLEAKNKAMESLEDAYS